MPKLNDLEENLQNLVETKILKLTTILQKAGFILILITLSELASATTIFNDGGVHVINGASDGIILTNSTTLNVTTGANILDPTAGRDGVRVTSSSVINVSGGAIAGANNAKTFDSWGGDGINVFGGTATISEGSFTGGNSVHSFGGNGIQAFALFNPSHLIISGGTFQGGNNTTASSFAGFGMRLDSGATALVSGRTFIGGNAGPGGGTDGFLSSDGLRIDDSSIEISGGTFAGGFQSTSIDARNASILDITDGIFLDPIDARGTSIFNISGGSFFDDWNVFDDSQFNIFGSDLSFVGSLLSGTLSDGSVISINVTRSNNASVNLFNVNVPEPATVWLFCSGLIGLVGMRKKSSNASTLSA